MKKIILFLLPIFIINFNLVSFFNYQTKQVFLDQQANPRFVDYRTQQGIIIYDTYQNQFYYTNFNDKIYLNSWTNNDLKAYIIDDKIHCCYLEEGQYYCQVDQKKISCDINDHTLKHFKRPIIDLNLYYQPITTERGWNGTLYQDDKWLQFISTLTTSDYLVCKSYRFMITKLIKAFNAKASKASCDQFDQFLNQKAFFSFKHLVNVINHHNLKYYRSIFTLH